MADLLRDLVDEFMLGLLPPFKLLIGLRSRSPNRLLLFRGWITEALDDDNPSSLPFRRFLVISLDRSLILVSVVRGLSGGRLTARDEARVRLDVDLALSGAREGREPFRLDLLPDLPFASLSNTLELPALLMDVVEAALGPSLDLDNRSMMEFFRSTGFFRFFSE